MGGNIKDRWSVPSTSVAHEFIDGYMAAANGEYVKVYLYVLRHQGEDITVEGIADALNHTESDARRALTYWERLGILSGVRREPVQAAPGPERRGETSVVPEHRRIMPVVPEGQGKTPAVSDYEGKVCAAPDYEGRICAVLDYEGKESPVSDHEGKICAVPDHGGKICTVPDHEGKICTVPDYQGKISDVPERHGGMAAGEHKPETTPREPVYSADQVNRLSQDEEFSQLLYIAQKYLNKVFTPRDCQVFAYLYENMGMDEELLEYLVEYCVQNGHTSVRYIEAVARNWNEKGIRTVQEAKDFSASYSKDSFAVMKAFGINSRKPAAPEQKLMDRWFKDYGFTREMVLEACNRTITNIHSPSFEYADKILADWKKSGIRNMTDLKELDARRTAAREENAQSRERRLQKYDTAVSSQGGRTRRAPNQFHNFDQRDTDYDALMLKQVKEWVEIET